MSKSRKFVFLFAVVGLNIVLFLYIKNEDNKFKANEQFANKLVNSIINDTYFYKDEISEKEDLEEIIVKRSLLQGEPEKVFNDYSYGTHEYYYCFENGTYIRIWFSDRNNPSKYAQINIDEPGSFRAEECRMHIK